MRYFNAISSEPLGPSSFAFAFRVIFAFRWRSGDEHFPGARKHGRGRVRSADHPRQLALPIGPLDAYDVGGRPPRKDALLDPEVRRPARGDLRQVGDAEHLKPLAKP